MSTFLVAPLFPLERWRDDYSSRRGFPNRSFQRVIILARIYQSTRRVALSNRCIRDTTNRICNRIFFPCHSFRAQRGNERRIFFSCSDRGSRVDASCRGIENQWERWFSAIRVKSLQQISRLQDIKFPPISLQNGFVECLKQQCPSIEGCYALLEPGDNECCYRCTGEYVYASLH